MKTHAQAVAVLTGKTRKRSGGRVSPIANMIDPSSGGGYDESGTAVRWTEYPERIVSVANTYEHHMSKARRAKRHRVAAKTFMRLGVPHEHLLNVLVFPLEITLVRIAPRELDGDNLQSGFKATRDGIADWLGIDDRDPAVTWKYAQEARAPKTYGVRVEIRRAP